MAGGSRERNKNYSLESMTSGCMYQRRLTSPMYRVAEHFRCKIYCKYLIGGLLGIKIEIIK